MLQLLHGNKETVRICGYIYAEVCNIRLVQQFGDMMR